MTQHTIEIPEETYQLLMRQAARLQLSPERVLEQLVFGDLALSPPEDIVAFDHASAVDETATALAAVERLTTLFADVSIPQPGTAFERSYACSLQCGYRRSDLMAKTLHDIPNQATVMLDTNVVIYALFPHGRYHKICKDLCNEVRVVRYIFE